MHRNNGILTFLGGPMSFVGVLPPMPPPNYSLLVPELKSYELAFFSFANYVVYNEINFKPKYNYVIRGIDIFKYCL